MPEKCKPKDEFPEWLTQGAAMVFGPQIQKQNERLEAELARLREENERLRGIAKDHEDDWRRIQDAEAERDCMSKAYNCIKTEYDNYINGRPGEWYIVQLKQERDRYKEALERIAYDCEHFSAPDEREKLIQKCLDVASAALGQSESDGK